MLRNRLSPETHALIEDYLQRLRFHTEDLPLDERENLIAYARAQIEMEMEFDPGAAEQADSARIALGRLGDPAVYAQRLHQKQAAPTVTTPASGLTSCRTCGKEVSAEAVFCPYCGAPFPARRGWKGTGYEWKSKATLWGWPLVHVAIGRDAHGKLRVAKGIIAIGQFGIGAITIAQFGIGAIFGLGQFMLAPLSLGQFAFGLAAAGQFGIGLLFGAGQFATGVWAYGMKALRLLG
jgi:hypothetical protein